MAKKIMQFRYYSDENEKNYPEGLTSLDLSSGSLFSNYVPITQLGIQTLPGVQFYLNNSTSPIIIGTTGIYELDLEGLAEITDLKIDIRSLQTIHENSSAYLIIDMICGEN